MGNATKNHYNRFVYSLQLGFFAGLIWGGVRALAHYFNFTEVSSGFLMDPLVSDKFMDSWTGNLTGWFLFILLSVVAAMLYAALFYKVKGPYLGMAYGLLWYGLIFLIIGPILGMMEPVTRLTLDTLLVEGCIFFLWGTFIGYTVAFEYTDEMIRDSGSNKKAK